MQRDFWVSSCLVADELDFMPRGLEGFRGQSNEQPIFLLGDDSVSCGTAEGNESGKAETLVLVECGFGQKKVLPGLGLIVLLRRANCGGLVRPSDCCACFDGDVWVVDVLIGLGFK